MKRYEAYKDSGVEWIGQVPINWQLRRLKYISDVIPSNIDKHIYPDEIKVKLCNYTDVYYNDSIDRSTLLSVGSCTEAEFSKYRLRKHDVIITKDSETPDDIGVPCIISEELEDVVCGYHLTLLRPRDISGEFLYRFIHSNGTRAYFSVNANGMTRYGLGKAAIECLDVCFPPLSEQTQIVAYLDAKTARIDDLIRKKEEKIALLKEYRSALINRCVTKGLNPDAPMKDSGVEWIGEVPGHWEVRRLKYISEVIPSNVDKHIYPEEIKVRLCNYTDVYYNDSIDRSTILSVGSCTDAEYGKCHLKKYDVIITKDSETPDDIGVPCIIKDELEDVVCGYHLTLIRPMYISGEFIYRFIQSNGTRAYFSVNANGMTRYGLGKSAIECLNVCFPPFSEQMEIVAYLDEKTAEIDQGIRTEEQKIELLKEYRQSLISAVVTGKIKVVN